MTLGHGTKAMAVPTGAAIARKDGSLRPYVTMWVVRAGDDLYVRSAYGP